MERGRGVPPEKEKHQCARGFAPRSLSEAMHRETELLLDRVQLFEDPLQIVQLLTRIGQFA
jgi:hypothetical protein